MDKQAKWITEAVEAIAETAVKEDGEYWRRNLHERGR